MIRRLAWRSWYYFRQGYSIYLSFLIGAFSNMIVIYKLAIVDVPTLTNFFPHLTDFIYFCVPGGLVWGVAVGYLHVKRTNAMRTDLTVGVEINPYNWIAVPGKERQITMPFAIVQLECQRALLKEKNLWTENLEARTNTLIKQLQKMIDGGRYDEV